MYFINLCDCIISLDFINREFSSGKVFLGKFFYICHPFPGELLNLVPFLLYWNLPRTCARDSSSSFWPQPLCRAARVPVLPAGCLHAGPGCAPNRLQLENICCCRTPCPPVRLPPQQRAPAVSLAGHGGRETACYGVSNSPGSISHRSSSQSPLWPEIMGA